MIRKMGWAITILLVLTVGLAQADEKVCPKCGVENQEMAKFCKDCGHEFGTEEPSEPVDERSPGEVLRDATKAYDTGKWEEALTQYQRLIELDPENVLAKEKITVCKRKIADEKQRRRASEKAAREKREYEDWRVEALKQRDYRVQTARGLLESGKTKEASKYILPAFAADWEWKVGRELLSEVLKKSGWSDRDVDVDGAFSGLSLAVKYREELKAQAWSLCDELLSGMLAIEISVSGAEVKVDGKRKGLSPIKSYSLKAGEYRIEAKKAGFHDASETVTITPGKTTTASIDLTPTTGFARITSQPSGASVFVSGGHKGETPLSGLVLPGGKRTVRLEKRLCKSWEGTIDIVEGKTATLEATLIEKTKGKAFARSLLFPGSGQRYRERRGIGWLYTIGEFAAVGAAVYSYTAYNSAHDDYESSLDAYEEAVTGHEELWEETRDRYDEADTKKQQLTITMSLAVGLYVWNLVDALLF